MLELHEAVARWMIVAGLGLGLPVGACAGVATLPERYRTTLRGDFVVIGNTLGFDGAPGIPVPVVGTVGPTGTNTAENAPDVYWRSNAPSVGQAQANLSLTADQARSQAVLSLPPGAVVRHARLYWAASLVPAAVADEQVTLSRVGAGGFSTTVTADSSAVAMNDRYQSTADITTLVQAAGAGAYQLSDINIEPFADLNDASQFAAWSMVVVYARPTDPPREIVIHDGLSPVVQGSPVWAQVNRVQPVAPSGGTAKLGLVVYEGDTGVGTDIVRLNAGTPLSNAANPANNFFNGTRSLLGAPVSVAGDLPQLTGTAGSMCGVDIDVVDITAVAPGPGIATLSFESGNAGDQYQPGVVVMAVTVPVVCPGDFNEDGAVNTLDLTIFLANFGQAVTPYSSGDLDGNGVVNTLDLTGFLAVFGAPCP